MDDLNVIDDVEHDDNNRVPGLVDDFDLTGLVWRW